MRRRYYYRGPQGFYHVYNRAVRRLKLFGDDADRGYFFRLLGLTAAKYKVPVIAWCLMDTHFHLVLNAPGAAISRMLQNLQRAYSRYYNEKTGFKGSLFEGRFCSTWIRDLESLAYVVRYVHANGRDAGVPAGAYMWSSYRSYLNVAGRPSWFDPRPLLDYHGGVEALALYTQAVPPLRKKKVRLEDRAQVAFVGHVVDRVRRRLEGMDDGTGVPLDLAAAWVGIRSFAARPKILAIALNWPSAKALSTAVSRFDAGLKEQPELRAALESS